MNSIYYSYSVASKGKDMLMERCTFMSKDQKEILRRFDISCFNLWESSCAMQVLQVEQTSMNSFIWRPWKT